jgi:hypothetical protein
MVIKMMIMLHQVEDCTPSWLELWLVGDTPLSHVVVSSHEVEEWGDNFIVLSVDGPVAINSPDVKSLELLPGGVDQARIFI